MFDLSLITPIISSVASAVGAYFVARRKNATSERINHAKAEANIQIEALNIVRDVMNDMREDFHRENEKLKAEIDSNKISLQSLQKQLGESDELIETLKDEILSLKKTLTFYEEEISRLRKGE